MLSGNAATVAYLNKQEESRNPSLQLVSQTIFWLAELNLLSISAVHVKGTNNQMEDFLSRHHVKGGEWFLPPGGFNLDRGVLGTPDIDLFASRVNRKVSYFCSLSIPWQFRLAYAFTPICLLPAVLQKFRVKSTSVILVDLFWPKRQCFAVLQSLLAQPPLMLPVRLDLLAQGPDALPISDRSSLGSLVTEGQLLRAKGLSDLVVETLLQS